MCQLEPKQNYNPKGSNGHDIKHRFPFPYKHLLNADQSLIADAFAFPLRHRPMIRFERRE